MVEPVQRGSIVDTLVSQLIRDILGGRYRPGSYLPPERDLAAGYSVTRTSLKHAFVRLEQLGLLTTKHGVGTQVRDYERLGGVELLPLLARGAGNGWTEEIFAVRQELGAVVAAKAAANASDDQRTQLQRLRARVAQAADADEAQLAECEVHRLLAAATQNRVYVFLVNSILNAYLPIRQLLREPFTDPQAAAERLGPLVDAVGAGDPATARETADAYLARTGHLMMADLSQGTGSSHDGAENNSAQDPEEATR